MTMARAPSLLRASATTIWKILVLPLSRLAAAVAIAACSMASIANPVLQGTTTNPTGFIGLEVDETIYNVTFTTQSYDAAFASISPTFLGNESGARDAAFALVSALNAADVTELGDYSFPIWNSVGNYNVYVPSEFYQIGVFSTYSASTSEALGYWQPLEGGGVSGQPGGLSGQEYNTFAIFSVQAVPEPSTIMLMAAGLAALALAHKKRSV